MNMKTLFILGMLSVTTASASSAGLINALYFPTTVSVAAADDVIINPNMDFTIDTLNSSYDSVIFNGGNLNINTPAHVSINVLTVKNGVTLQSPPKIIIQGDGDASISIQQINVPTGVLFDHQGSGVVTIYYQGQTYTPSSEFLFLNP